MHTRTMFLVIATAFATATASTPNASAHCDTLDGPVAKAGQKALDTGDLDFALVWVKPDAETELRGAFKQALTVRKLGKDARKLADGYFLETLVRLHRAGEGEPYTGLKPKGTDVGPAIPAADAAIQAGSTAALSKMIDDAVADGLLHRLHEVTATRKYKSTDISAGRAHVEAYVTFMHYVENLYTAATGATGTEHAAIHRE